MPDENEFEDPNIDDIKIRKPILDKLEGTLRGGFTDEELYTLVCIYENCSIEEVMVKVSTYLQTKFPKRFLSPDEQDQYDRAGK